MKQKAVWLKSVVITTALGITLAGCAGMQNKKAIQVERLLAASGFQMKLADTPERLAHLKTLTQRKLVPHQRDGKVHYVYADATFCQCLYVGSEKAYQRYRDLALKQNLAAEQRYAAEMNEAGEMNWGMWGAWQPMW
jgi:hypothetical protein